MTALVESKVLARAQVETGLADWGDLTLEERVGLVIDLINTDHSAGAGHSLGECRPVRREL